MFLPRLGADFIQFGESPASTSDMSILNKIVLQQLRIPVLDPPGAITEAQSRWKEGPYCLVKTPLCDGWTGHSERCTMPSLLASMGVPKAERDPLGRWSPSGSDDDVRTYRALIRDLMGRVRRAVSLGELANFAEEDEAVNDARIFASRFGAYTDDELAGAAKRLSESAASLFSALAGRPAQLESPTDEGEAGEGPIVEGKPPLPGQDGWGECASGLVSRSKVAQHRLGQPLDPSISSAALELWECRDVPATKGCDYQPVAPYLVVGGQGKVRRLHRADGCWRATSLAFKEYELIDSDPVPAEVYTHFCRKCWPLSAPSPPEGSGEDAEVSSASSSSSDA